MMSVGPMLRRDARRRFKFKNFSPLKIFFFIEILSYFEGAGAMRFHC